MKFIDLVEIKVQAGDGGPGMNHFRREKFIPNGGPDGGDGGKGGDVYVLADANLNTLLEFRYRRLHEAEFGHRGGTNNRAGAQGEDLILKVPCGTTVFDAETEGIVGEVLKDGDKLLVAKGGRGGLGNRHFVSSRNQAPTKTVPAETGEQKSLRFELKLIADVAIIGAPNAGKSTLISVVSAAKPKVADYPFTTLVPNLGVVQHKNFSPFVLADVPGLIAGASQGKGLGHGFLRHIERTRVLVHLIDSQQPVESMISDYEGIVHELKMYNEDLLKRPRVTVISKVETQDFSSDERRQIESFKQHLQKSNIDAMEISAANRFNIDVLLDSLVGILSSLEPENKKETKEHIS